MRPKDLCVEQQMAERDEYDAILAGIHREQEEEAARLGELADMALDASDEEYAELLDTIPLPPREKDGPKAA